MPAWRQVALLHVKLHGLDEVVNASDDDAQVNVHYGGVATDVLINDRLHGRDVLGDKVHAQVLFSRHNEAV